MAAASASRAHHLFVRFRARATQIKELWRSVGKVCEWKHPRAPSVRLLFQDERATPAVLTFIREIKVGRVVILAPPLEAEEWGGLEEMALRPEGGALGFGRTCRALASREEII